jgi:DnaJ-class molecular chaperone
MRNRSGPPAKIPTPDMADCKKCLGRGWIKGMFHEIPCHPCDANGEVKAESGESLSKETMVFVLKKRLKQKEVQIAYLESLIQSDSKKKGHWDEFKSVNGGKQRFD